MSWGILKLPKPRGREQTVLAYTSGHPCSLFQIQNQALAEVRTTCLAAKRWGKRKYDVQQIRYTQNNHGRSHHPNTARHCFHLNDLSACHHAESWWQRGRKHISDAEWKGLFVIVVLWSAGLYVGVTCSHSGRLVCTKIKRSFWSSSDKFDLHTDKTGIFLFFCPQNCLFLYQCMNFKWV